MAIDFGGSGCLLEQYYEREDIVGKKIEIPDISSLPLDDRFLSLLHKKIMYKKGAVKRQAKKYYIDQYKKTGVIPMPLILAGKGIMEGRRCSGRKRSLSKEVEKRFIEMVKASADQDDDRFIFVTQKARTITNYHKWLKEDFGKKISIHALRLCAKRENLDIYLKKPDFDEDQQADTYFNPEPVFDLVQVDGCNFHYLKIRDENGHWRKPQVIEFYDTGSRYMFVLDVYFSESNLNSVDLFTQFLQSTPFPKKIIRIRPDNAKGFRNLKHPIRELNLKYSMPEKFYMKPDFTRINAPKDKVQLESSHRHFHNFEISIIRKFQDKIVKTEPGTIRKNGKLISVTVTFLNINIHELKKSRIIESYRNEHNDNTHRFQEEGRVMSWIPKEKFLEYMSDAECIEFNPEDVKVFMRYGFRKIKASVWKGSITYKKQKYIVVQKEKFKSNKSIQVYISECDGKLLIFEQKEDGIFLGEAFCQGPSVKPQNKNKAENRINLSRIDLIIEFLQDKDMLVDMDNLILRFQKGLTLKAVKEIYEKNKDRYNQYTTRLVNLKDKENARFNAFMMDCDRFQCKDSVAPYANLQKRE